MATGYGASSAPAQPAGPTAPGTGGIGGAAGGAVVGRVVVEDDGDRAGLLRVVHELSAERGAVADQRDRAAHVDAGGAQGCEVGGQPAVRVEQRSGHVAVRGAGVEREADCRIEGRRVGRITDLAQLEVGRPRPSRADEDRLARPVEPRIGVEFEHQLARRVDVRGERFDPRVEAVLAQQVAGLQREGVVGRRAGVVRVRAQQLGGILRALGAGDVEEERLVDVLARAGERIESADRRDGCGRDQDGRSDQRAEHAQCEHVGRLHAPSRPTCVAGRLSRAVRAPSLGGQRQ